MYRPATPGRYLSLVDVRTLVVVTTGTGQVSRLRLTHRWDPIRLMVIRLTGEEEGGPRRGTVGTGCLSVEGEDFLKTDLEKYTCRGGRRTRPT